MDHEALDESTRRALMRAGAASVPFNSPMGVQRAEAIADYCAASGANTIDLGCGRGHLALGLGERHPHHRVWGVDTDAGAIADARRAAATRGLGDRVRFEVADASVPGGSADTAVCIGASHALGGTASMLESLGEYGRAAAVVGEGVWVTPAPAALREIFGDLPVGLEALASLAEAAGWTIADASVSSLDEWDSFEAGWIDGVRGVGTPEAHAFADNREAEYRTYRGVLGFGWLFLRR